VKRTGGGYVGFRRVNLLSLGPSPYSFVPKPNLTSGPDYRTPQDRPTPVVVILLYCSAISTCAFLVIRRGVYQMKFAIYLADK